MENLQKLQESQNIELIEFPSKLTLDLRWNEIKAKYKGKDLILKVRFHDAVRPEYGTWEKMLLDTNYEHLNITPEGEKLAEEIFRLAQQKIQDKEVADMRKSSENKKD